MAKLRRVSINSLRNLKSYRDMINAKKVSDTLVQALANAGEDIINKAYQRRDWNNRTGNLHDSYISAVFVNDTLIESSIRFVDDGTQLARRAVEVGAFGTKYWSGDPIQTTGHEEALEFIKAYKKRGRGKMDKVQLVVAAAMYYSGILESKGYTVISNIEWDLIDLLRDGIYAEGLLTTSIPVEGMVHRLAVVDPRGTRFSFANLD